MRQAADSCIIAGSEQGEIREAVKFSHNGPATSSNYTSVCFQMLNNNFGIAPGGQSNKFDAPTIPKYANLILSNLCGCNPPPLYTTSPWLGLWKSNVPGPHLVRAGVGSPTMNPPPGGPFVPPSGGLVLFLSISRCNVRSVL